MDTTVLPVTAGWRVHARLRREQLTRFQRAGIDLLHAQLLHNRGIREAEPMRRFIDARYDQVPDPLLLIDMDRALARVQRALASREHITVFGDYDADGVTSAALVFLALRRLGHPESGLSWYIPHREAERGLSLESLDDLRARGTSLVITTDCGSSDTEACAYATSLGIDVVITDHHQSPDRLPEVCALVNPWRADCTYPERVLCGVGVAWKLVQALFRACSREQEALEFLDLVAIGTVADVAQLVGENHTLVRLGLQRLNQTRHRGLRALIQGASLRPGGIREREIGYALAPRINAAARMEHAGLAFLLMICEDEQEASAFASSLDALNQLRRQQTDALLQLAREQAQSQLEERLVLVYGDRASWPEGIIGLVAGKLAEEIRRPVFVLSQGDGNSRGSARSYGDFDLMEALRARADLFERHGGHAQAAGFTIANARIEELHTHLLTWAGQSPGLPASDEELPSALPDVPDVPVADLLIGRPAALTYEAYTRVQQIGPFGKGNPEPVFCMRGLRLVRCWVSGWEGRNLQVRLQAGDQLYSGTYARGGELRPSYREGSPVDVLFSLDLALSRGGQEAGESPGIWLKILAMESAAP
jgi:single-stranded-DNA-specific exonuclease